MDVVVKRKPKQPKTSKTPNGGDNSNKRNTVRWVAGLILLAFSAYALLVSTKFLFNWQHYLDGSEVGSGGAWISTMLITNSFGVFGMLLPMMGIIFAFKVIAKRVKLYDHTLISFALVTILGSLTLGAIFGAKYNMFNSGWGGAFGIEIVGKLDAMIGMDGITILLILSWILTAVYINVKVIELLNSLGSGIVNTSKGLFGRIFRKKEAEDSVDATDDTADDSADDVADDTTDTTDTIDTTEDDLFEDEPADQIEDEPIVVDTPQTPEPEPEPEVEPEPEAESEPEPEPELVPEPEPETEPETEPVAVTVDEPAEDDKQLVVNVIDPDGDKELADKEADKHIPFNPDRTLHYNFPSVELLDERESNSEVDDEEIRENTRNIEQVLADFKISIVNVTATTGPTVTLYEVELDRGVKVSKVEGLSKEIAQALKASSVRVAPIPESGTVGIEVPNRNPSIVSMRAALRTERYVNFKGELPVVIGRNIQNECIVFDLAKMPHLLVAGATGTGKSVGLNVILTSLLYRKDPSQLKLVLIDPKQVEFSLYEGLGSHFLARMESEEENIVIDAQKAVYTLYSLCAEMEERLKKCRLVGTRNIMEYNDLVRKCKIESHELMPYIVVVIDEYADLVTQSKLVEQPVMRLAQKARAAGIHLILATQRPSVDILTGRIKTNFPARIAFRVSSRVDSGTIIDQPGAQALIGRGDMLFSEPCALTRLQCAFVDTPEVKRIVDYIAAQPSPTGMPYLLPDYEESGGASTAAGSSGSSASDLGSGYESSGAAVKYDALFAEIARDAVSGGDNFSTSYIQRTYEVGFVRAGRIMLQLERAGIVGPQVPGAKSRDVKIYDLPTLEAKLQDLGVL